VDFKDAEEIRQVYEKADEWKKTVYNLLSMDLNYHLNNKEKLKNCLNEARLQKLPESMTKNLALVYE